MATTTTKSGVIVKVEKQNPRRYAINDLPKILSGAIEEIATKKLRKTLELSEFKIYFVAQQDIINDLKDFEKLARKAIADEIAQGRSGSEAEITDIHGKKIKAHTFLKSSAMYTERSVEEPGTDSKGRPTTLYKTTEAQRFNYHNNFIKRFSDKKDWQLGHRTLANSTVAAEIYLSRIPKSAPRRDKIAKILAGMRLLDETQGKFLSYKEDNTIDTLESMSKVFEALEALETIDSVADYTRSIDLLRDRSHIQFDAIYQPGKENNDMGRISRRFLAEIRKVIQTGNSKFLDGYKLSHVASSKTFMRALKDQLIDIALDKSTTGSTAKSKAKKRKKLKLGMSQKNAKFKKQKAEIKGALRKLHATEALTKGSRSRTQGSGSADSIAPLMALLNQKLPQTVVKNMGPPGLENQTGRFASSARVTDVSRTAQGYPSIGYTYRRNPYQVFETGSGQAPWATPDRDPRKLIDASIREIAAQLAIGRFYTRRV